MYNIDAEFQHNPNYSISILPSALGIGFIQNVDVTKYIETL